MKHASSIRSYPWWLYAIAGVATFCVTSLGTFASFAAQYKGSGLPNVYVAKQNYPGMDAQAISAELSAEISDEQVTVTVEGRSLTLPLSETGLHLNAVKTAESVVAPSLHGFTAVATVFSARHVDPSFSVDEARFASFVERVNALSGQAPVSASVKLNEAGDHFEVVPASTGKGVDAEALQQAIVGVALTPGNTALTMPLTAAEPVVPTESAQKAADEANTFLAQEFALTFGGEKLSASMQDKASWLNVTANADGKLVVNRNVEAARKWATDAIARANRPPINGITHVDAAGNKLELARPTKMGRQVTNAELATTSFVAGVTSGEGATVTLETTDVPGGMDEVVKPAGRERFAYQPRTPKEKWVDVNLTYSTLTAYEGYTPVFGPILINHGGVGHETVTGTYHVYLKYDKQDMGCTPEWDYCEKDVPSVSYWHQSYALHGAPWVKEFGIGTDESSHGCINIEPKDAEWIHGFTEIGTTVVTHY